MDKHTLTSKKISRRGFLKAGCLGAAAVGATACGAAGVAIAFTPDPPPMELLTTHMEPGT